MLARRQALLLVVIAALVAGAAPGVDPAAEPVRLIVENKTYSSLSVSMQDAAGREVPLGQAPPAFSNTLVIREPLPSGPVRLHARLAGERDPLYRSPPVTLASGARLRWRLPDNVIE